MSKVPRHLRWIGSLAILFLLLTTIMRCITWWYFKPADVYLAESLPVFWLGFRYDAREAGILSLVLLITGSFRFLHPFETRVGKWLTKGIVFVATTLTVLFFLFDFLHFRYLLQRLNASALSFLEDAKISGSMVWQTYPVISILLGVVTAIALIMWSSGKLYSSIKRRPFSGTKGARVAWFIGTFLLAALGIFGRIGQYPLRWSDAFNTGSDFSANIALNPFQSFFSSLHSRASTYDIEKVQRYYPQMQEYLSLPAIASPGLSFARTEKTEPRAQVLSDSIRARRPNIVLVICESFSAYKSSMWGNPLNATPFFNALCKKGILFNNCFTPHVGTARGVWATITGIPDVEMNKTASRNPRMVDQRSIINEFAGYEKLYMMGGSSSWANIRGLLTNNIQQLKLYEEEDYKAKAIDVWGISDKNLFLEANQVLKKQTRPFFAVIQTADNHRPYTIPEEDLSTFKKINLPPDSLKKYGFESNEELNAFRYTDFCFQQFMEAAEKEPYYQNTIFAFIGDHGIAGNAAGMFPPSWTDEGLTAYHVPLLFYSPMPLLAGGKTIGCAVSQVDVLPTLAGLANLPSYQNTALGRDLLKYPDSCRGSKAFIMDHNNKTIGIISNGWYYSRSLDGKREKMVWADFQKPASPVPVSSIQLQYREDANAFYETARYLLLNNKK